jgi:putative membrane protein
MKLTREDHSLLSAAVVRAEQKTSAELVVSVRPSSSTHTDIAAGVGAVGATFALIAVMYSDVDFDPLHVAPIVLGAGWFVFAAVLLAAPLARLAPARTRRSLDDAAHAAFSRYGVHRTRDHTGILVFYSLRERAGRILFDAGIAQAVPADVRDEWRARLNACRNAPDLASLLDDIGERAGQFLPRNDDDVDELGNGVEVSG